MNKENWEIEEELRQEIAALTTRVKELEGKLQFFLDYDFAVRWHEEMNSYDDDTKRSRQLDPNNN